jgi:hypothetical protein
MRVRGHGRTSAQAAVQSLRRPVFGLTSAHLPDGLTARSLIAPVPLYAWHAVWNTAAGNPAVSRALELVNAYARSQGWHRPPAADWWLPQPDCDALPSAP